MSRDRIRRRQALRRQALLGAWLIAVAGLFGRAVQVQVLEAEEWSERAVAQHRQATEVPASRGTIYDRDGVPLAVSREQYRVEIDSDLLPERDSVRDALVRVLGLAEAKAHDLTDPRHEWRVVPGSFEPSVRSELERFKGVYLYRELEREYPYDALSAGILGNVTDGSGAGGIEQAFDDILAGHPGRMVQAKDVARRPIPGEVLEIQPPQAGGDVHLTIDLDLQEIVHQAMENAIEENQARGGDLVIADPQSGEILAMVSIHDGASNSLSVVNSPFEPGSTLKPFTVAALLESGTASLSDPVEVGNGQWRVNGRTLTDVHVDSTTISLAGALRESSNVGIARAALPLSSREQYENLRDFGFGLPTGIELPGESGGSLRHPRDWKPMSAQSLAIGYEINATPLQMAMAYGALANGGNLMEARLVSKTRAPEGRERVHEPEVVRRVVDEAVTRQLNTVLTAAVREGTGTRASLEAFDIAGKTGTARVFNPDIGDYENGRYFASFVGYFPADDPQLVIVVKLDSPSGGAYYGGATAAPVARATMEAALAARRSPIDREGLVDRRDTRSAAVLAADPSSAPFRFAVNTRDTDLPDRPQGGDLIVPGPTSDPTEIPVPDVSDLSLRDAVRQLHRHGFRVRIEPGGELLATRPEPGDRWAVGDTVRLWSGIHRTGRVDR